MEEISLNEIRQTFSSDRSQINGWSISDKQKGGWACPNREVKDYCNIICQIMNVALRAPLRIAAGIKCELKLTRFRFTRQQMTLRLAQMSRALTSPRIGRWLPLYK